MQLIEVSRWKSVSAFLFLILTLGYIWLELTTLYFHTLDGIQSHKSLVDINVYGLWMPIGFIGVLLYTLIAFLFTIKTKKRALDVWGKKGHKASNILVGSFAALGVLFAVFNYYWMTDTLEKSGYTYCKPLSRLSAMGRHEVYVSKPELCVKRSR